MSFKDNIRKTIVAISAMVIAASLFTGCTSNETISDEEPYSSEASTPIDSETSGSDSDIDNTSEPEESTTSSNVTSSSDSKPEESTSSDPVAPENSASDVSEPTSTTESKPEQSSTKPVESKPAESKPVESKPTQSSNTPSGGTHTIPGTDIVVGGEEYIPGKNNGYTPDDTTGIELDENGHPADAIAWRKKYKKNFFVDSTGKLWNYDPGIGWHEPSPGGLIADHSDTKPSGNIIGY